MQRHVTLAPTISPRVTAGLTWQPDTCPIVAAMVATVSPKHRAILTILAWSLRVLLSPPTQLNTRVLQTGHYNHHDQPATPYEDQDQGAHQLSCQALHQLDRLPEVRDTKEGEQYSTWHYKSGWDWTRRLTVLPYLRTVVLGDMGQFVQSKQLDNGKIWVTVLQDCYFEKLLLPLLCAHI